jgi:putative Mg2+ transporter-C (MgtC) family protein
MNGDGLQIVLALLASVAMGGAIGIERTLQGHAAGFRTHALVCLTSCALMLLAAYPSAWMTVNPDLLRGNITRVIQGVMTGIGFLGAGIIMKQGLEVRGLTTAAGIWSAAGIGILVGVGSLWTAFAATAITLLVLTVFRRVEERLRVDVIVHVSVRFAREEIIAEDDLCALVKRLGFSIDELTYALDARELFAYRLVIKTRTRDAIRQLAMALRAQVAVREFDVALRRD